MYIPKANEEKSIPVMQQFIREHPLCALVTQTAAGMFASHIPMALQDDGSEFGLLRGHVSRANLQWKNVEPSVEALAIFTGTEHYISPSWYPGKAEHGKVVPTWNYVAVHVYGPLRVVEDAEWKLAHLHELTDRSEAGSAAPWKVSDAPQEFIETMMKGIVGLEIAIRRMEGKWKVSQNRGAEDVAAVMHGLEELGSPESLAMKALVGERCPRRE